MNGPALIDALIAGQRSDGMHPGRFQRRVRKERADRLPNAAGRPSGTVQAQVRRGIPEAGGVVASDVRAGHWGCLGLRHGRYYTIMGQYFFSSYLLASIDP